MTYQENLTEVRRTLLDLHKALIERERAEYEKSHGPVSAGEMLQLLIRDDQFSWLHPVSAVIVRVDELISNAKERRRPNPTRPAMTPEQVSAESAALLVDIRELLASGDAPNGFRERYDAALKRDPAIVLLHQAVLGSLPPDRA
jgi:ligand-binding sensor domain-containing protein